jgi:hypothetical protein
VPSQLSRTNSPNLNYFRPPLCMNKCNKCLFFFLISFAFKSQCAHSILCNHCFIRSLPAHLKKNWQGTSLLWVRTTALYHGICYFILKFHDTQSSLIYRVSIKSFPDYKHLLQENCVEYKRSTCWSVLMCCKKKTSWVELHFGGGKIKVCIPCSFLVINVF